jgi:hypothetical protein
MDPAMMAAAMPPAGLPMDPSMMAPPGMPPGMPMDPSMMAPPGMPMDPSMMGLPPELAGVPPEAMGLPPAAPPEGEAPSQIVLTMDDLKELLSSVLESKAPKGGGEGGEKGMEELKARLDALEATLGEIMQAVGGKAPQNEGVPQTGTPPALSPEFFGPSQPEGVPPGMSGFTDEALKTASREFEQRDTARRFAQEEKDDRTLLILKHMRANL